MQDTPNNISNRVDIMVQKPDCDPTELLSWLQCLKICRDIYSNKYRQVNDFIEWTKKESGGAIVSKSDGKIALELLKRFIDNAKYI